VVCPLFSWGVMAGLDFFLQRKRLLRYIALIAVTVSCLSAVQFTYTGYQQDDWYHIRAAEMLRQDGIRRDFPWMARSILNENFCDLHFLYHVLLIPFTFGNLMITGKIAAVLFAAGAVVILCRVFEIHKIPFPLFWSLLLFGSLSFLLRMLALRPISLSVIFLVLLFHLLLREKYIWILPLTYCFVLSYSAFPVFFIVVLVHGAVYAAYHRRLEWRPVLYCFAGTAAGLLLNPYFPANLRALWVQDVLQLLPGQSVELSAQVFPLDTWSLFINSWAVFGVLFLVLLFSFKRGRKSSFAPVFLFAQCAIFLLVFLRVPRGIDFFIVSAVFLGAFLFQGEQISLSPVVKAAGCVFLACMIAVNGFQAYEKFRVVEKVRNEGSALWLKNNTPAGSEVFLSNYGAFPQLFYYNRHNVYTFGLSGIFMYAQDRKLYGLYLDTINLRSDPYPIIKNDFDVRWIHVENVTRSIAFYRYLRNNPRLYGMVYQDEFSTVFEVH